MTDGSTKGTRLFLETIAGFESAEPKLLGSLAGVAFGSVKYRKEGREPFILSNGAGQSDAGRPCGRNASILFCDDPVLGRTMVVEGRFAPSGSIGVLALGPIAGRPVLVPGTTCTLQVELLQALALQPVTITRGSWQHAMQLPLAPGLAGVRAALQCYYVHPSGSLEATQGVHMTLGS